MLPEDIGVTDHAVRQALAEDRCNAEAIVRENPAYDLKKELAQLALEEIQSDNPNDCPDLGSESYSFRAVWNDERLREPGHLIISEDRKCKGRWVIVTVLSDSVFQQRRGKKYRKKSGLPDYFVVYPNGDGETHAGFPSADSAVKAAEDLIQSGKPANRVGIYGKLKLEVSLVVE